MYEISDAMKFALGANANSSVHRLRGMIGIATGEKIYFGDWEQDKEPVAILGTPSYNKQCVANVNNFAIGQLYTGTASVSLALTEYRTDVLRGAELTMEFGVNDLDEWIPLGRWTINDPRRDNAGQVTVNAVDCIAALDVPFPKFVGGTSFRSRLEKIHELTGVEFAQTHEEILEMMGGKFLVGTPLVGTCRSEVCAIAQMIGGFAVANRENKLEFRRFGMRSVLQIQADLRQNASLSEYTYGVRGLAYIDEYGHRTDITWEGQECNTAATMVFSDNPFVWDTCDEEKADSYYKRRLEAVEAALRRIAFVWTPGQIEYYGNPALDLGDVVKLNNGIGNGTLFLITADSWRFRAPQTLISAGAGDGVSSGTASGGLTSTQQSITNVNLTKNIIVVPMIAHIGELTDVLRTIAEGAFSVRSETAVFAQITAETAAAAPSDVRLHYLYDGIKQTVQAVNTMGAGETRTISLPLCITASTGTHTISVEASGAAEISRIEAYIYGQNITPEQPELTTSQDYEYTVSDGAATITKYIGTSRKPAVPASLGGAPVKAIGAGAFMGTEVEYVYIQEGVEEIR